MYLLAPFMYQNLKKKILEQIQNYEDVPLSGSKWLTYPVKFFFGTNHYYYFHLPIPFINQNLKKCLQRIQSYEDALFLGPKWSICHKQIFLGQIISNLPISPLHCAKILKILPADPEL